jgi:probable phosphoglycerate mutase
VSIYLIRHGETAGNRARIVQLPDIPLSERGIAQARLLAARLASAGIAHILSSDLPRARMTAEPLAHTTDLDIHLDPDLQERNFGDLRGTPYTDLEATGIDLFAPHTAPPGGETWKAFHERVDRLWQRATQLAAEVDGHLALVTHGLVCHSIAARLVEPPSTIARDSYGSDGPPLRFGNTAVSVLKGPSPWRFDLFACTAHLEGAVAEDGSALV